VSITCITYLRVLDAQQNVLQSDTHLICEYNRVREMPLDVFAPPAAVRSALATVLCDPLNYNKPARTLLKHCIAKPCSGQIPICGGISSPPRCSIGLIEEVGSDHIWM
jgi:hypothetical protein